MKNMRLLVLAIILGLVGCKSKTESNFVKNEVGTKSAESENKLRPDFVPMEQNLLQTLKEEHKKITSEVVQALEFAAAPRQQLSKAETQRRTTEAARISTEETDLHEQFRKSGQENIAIFLINKSTNALQVSEVFLEQASNSSVAAIQVLHKRAHDCARILKCLYEPASSTAKPKTPIVKAGQTVARFFIQPCSKSSMTARRYKSDNKKNPPDTSGVFFKQERL